MEEKKEDIIFIFFLFFSSVIFLFDLFLHQGLPTTFDNPFHTTNLAQFFLALKDFEFPVRWADGFGNYGLPIPIVAHQVTSYIGALILFLVADPELSLKILYFSAIFFSSFFYYVFLRKFFPPLYSFSGAFFYTFSSYKIFNTYVRGALPELFSAIFLPLILLGILLIIKEKSIKGFFLIIGAVALLALNHPMMLFIYAFIYFPFFLWTVFSEGRSENLSVVASFLQRRVIAFILALGIGILIAGYYIIPLMIETKYFYYGTSDISFTPGNYLTVENFLNSSWPYFTEKDIGTRGHVVTVGILETIVFMIGGVMALLSVKSKSYADKGGILLLAVVNGVGIIFLMLPFAESIFSLIKLLGSVQFQWRFLSAFIFFPPIILSYLLTKLNKQIFAVLVIPLIALVTFPQLYGKNYVLFDREIYFLLQLMFILFL